MDRELALLDEQVSEAYQRLRSSAGAIQQDSGFITGDSKAFTNGTANANASWSCTGFENRRLTDKYPVCPRGSCWDGRGVDSADHRTHVAYADPRTGACPAGFKAVPQLVQRLVHDVAPPSLRDNGKSGPFTPSTASRSSCTSRSRTTVTSSTSSTNV